MNVSSLLLLSFLLLAVFSTCGGEEEEHVGPVRFLPKCPARKNFTVGKTRMKRFDIVLHRLSENGTVYRRPVNILNAHQYITNKNYIDVNKKTLVYVLGWLDSSVFPQNFFMASSFLKRGYNVIYTDTILFASRNYFKMTRLTYPLSDKISDFLVQLYEIGVKADDIEISGLSLGAHIAAMSAKYFYEKTGKKVGVLTGLDPAGPCFRDYDVEDKFSEKYAERVVVLHTNINGFGMGTRLGHVDFYLNGGEYQMNDINGMPCLIICSHLKSQLYWWVSVMNPEKFIGVKCDSPEKAIVGDCFDNKEYNVIGLETDFNKPGIYYVGVRNSYPYFMGKDGLDPKKVAEAKKGDSRSIFGPVMDIITKEINAEWLNDDLTLKYKSNLKQIN